MDRPGVSRMRFDGTGVDLSTADRAVVVSGWRRALAQHRLQPVETGDPEAFLGIRLVVGMKDEQHLGHP